MALNIIGTSGPFSLPPASFDIAKLRTALETAIPGNDAGRAARVAAALQDAKAQTGDTKTLANLSLSPSSIRVGANSTVLIEAATDGSELTISVVPDGLELSSAQRVLSGVAQMVGDYDFDIIETLPGAIGSPKRNRLTLKTTHSASTPTLDNTLASSDTVIAATLDGFATWDAFNDARLDAIGV